MACKRRLEFEGADYHGINAPEAHKYARDAQVAATTGRLCPRMLENVRLVGVISITESNRLNDTFAMSEKRHYPHRSTGHKTVAGHGTFKHTAKGATLKAVLGAYGLSQSDYKRVRDLVVSKEPAHAR